MCTVVWGEGEGGMREEGQNHSVRLFRISEERHRFFAHTSITERSQTRYCYCSVDVSYFIYRRHASITTVKHAMCVCVVERRVSVSTARTHFTNVFRNAAFTYGYFYHKINWYIEYTRSLIVLSSATYRYEIIIRLLWVGQNLNLYTQSSRSSNSNLDHSTTRIHL